jgi:hypothetical protein
VSATRAFFRRWFQPPGHDIHRRSVTSGPRIIWRKLWLEQLESRIVPTTITRTSSSIFYNDLGGNLTSEYASYKITNNDGVSYADVWATIGNFTAASGSPVVTLGANAASSIDLGPLANGQSKTAFFYLGSSGDTNVAQTHTVKVFNGNPITGSLLTSQNFSFTSVEDTISANSNKVSSVVVTPPTPTIGDSFTITVTGETGTIGSANVVDFTPAAFSSWRADAFQLTGTQITFTGGNIGIFLDTLVIPPAALISSANTNYTAVYTFQVVGPTATSTAVSPVGYISSGSNVKHTDTGTFDSLSPIQPPMLASPTLVTAPTPATVKLGTTPVTLTDTADLENGFRPTGTITFTLVHNNNTVDTETATVNGNGTYTTPTGFTLPTTGTVTGTYQWNATYNGDTNNNPASDIGAANERVTVSPASPTLVTTASQNVTLPTGLLGTVTLSDSAVLSGGYSPTGSIVFTLTGPGGFSYTQTDTVSGDGNYTASTTLPTSGMVAGTYTWTARYGGDGNNSAARDQGGIKEQTVVSQAKPTLITTTSPNTLAPGVTLKDTAILLGGYHPTGSITFTLFFNGGSTPVDTEMVTVNGNGSYTTPNGFTPGSASGVYQWNATYTGDNNNNSASDLNNPTEQVTVDAPPLTFTTTPIPITVTLGVNSVTLNDSADLEGGVNPTGTITFKLIEPGGGTVDTETASVAGNGSYTTPTGFTLPTTGTVTGTYQWNASYSGDPSNPAASEITNVNEQVDVSAASPTIVTIASPNLTLPTGPPGTVTLSDLALLSGGYSPTGSIVFTLTGPGGFSYTQTDTVSGNGIYAASTTLPTSGMVAGTYTWTARYSGDSNNNADSDQGGVAEQTVVSPASPTLTTTPPPSRAVLAATSTTLKDTAILANGYHPVGTITFTLVAPDGSTVDTETVTVNGNGTYTTPTGFTLPTSGTVTGIYQWNATYSGGPNNNPASDIDDVKEQVTVSPATPTLSTTPTPDTVTLGTTAVTLKDTAVLVNGYHPTGTITFTLLAPGGGMVDTETVAVNGNRTYTTPTGFTLPSSGSVAGTYQWVALYSGDDNNAEVGESNPVDEAVTVIQATPTLVTTASPSTVKLPVTGGTLTDSADLEGGFNPTGSIVFTLTGPGGFSYTQPDTVTGNGTYTATLLTALTTSGTYTWTAIYEGDDNNDAVDDQGGAAEQTIVGSASLSLVTLASPNLTLPASPPGTVTLSDRAFLSGGQAPIGSIVFTLTGPGSFSYTQTDTVTGNGTYTASTTLPTAGVVAGTYTWTAHYGGDANNNATDDEGGVLEQTIVSPARPMVVTTAGVLKFKLSRTSSTLNDIAVLAGGYNPTGALLFTLKLGSNTVFTDTETVTGNGIYTTPGYALPTTGTVVGTYTWTVAYNGDPNNNSANDQGGAAEQVIVNPTIPTLTTTPDPTVITLADTPPPLLKDSATLDNGFNPTGTITFTLFYNGGSTAIDTEMATVTGNGTYTTPTGFPLPTSGTVTGTYQWVASYSGDTNNTAVSDGDPASEQVTVNAATPTLTTDPSPLTVTLGTATPPILTDTADLENGYNPTGTITFALFYNGGTTPVRTEMVTVTANGSYTTPTGFTLPSSGSVAGTYQWVAVYSGDDNNTEVGESNPEAEKVEITQATPTLITTASPSTVPLPVAGGTLTDSADLEGGFNPTGSIDFTLTGPGGFSYTQTDTVTGNGTYTATLPTALTTAGTYTWIAIYEGDDNNAAVDDQGGAAEQTIVGSASPTLVTLASPNMTLPTGPPGTVTLKDLAFLSGAQSPTGSIVFTLTGPGGFSYTQPDTVNGNGTYRASTTLPTSGMVAGTYTWTAQYGGDANNIPASDQGGAAEQTIVSPARPTVVTSASLLGKTLDTTSPTLNDTAVLAGGYNPMGALLFTLKLGSSTVFTDTETVTGNGTYTTPGYALPTTGTVAGTYTWTVAYSGDANNNPANDQGGTAEQTVLSPIDPKLATAASSALTRRGNTNPTLVDTAVLSGGFNPTGSIDFTLTGPGGFSYTQTDTVTGNGIYIASTTLPATVPGTYTWVAQYHGDGNNNSASDQGGTIEQVIVEAASPTLTTTASPSAIALGDISPPLLTDSAILNNGSNPTGTITFTLFYNGGSSPIDTEKVTVNGNGVYNTPAGFTLPSSGPVTGTYQLNASYSGDANNNPADDENAPDEQVTITAVTPAISTTANPSTGHFGTVLQDSANLTGGYNPTGTIVFKLYAPGVDPTVGPAAYTENVVVTNGNSTYSTTKGFATTSTGTWQWVASYGGDANNNAVASGALDEPVTIPEEADLVLVKNVSPTQQMVGFKVTYTFILHNNGPDPATNVVVTDPFPAGLTIVGPNTPSQGTFDPATGIWNVGTLPSGATATLTVTARIVVLGPITNTASVTGDQFDPALSNNTDAAGVTGMRPPGMVSKRFFLSGAAANDPPAAGTSSTLSSGSFSLPTPSTLATNTASTGNSGSIAPFASTVASTTPGNDTPANSSPPSAPSSSISPGSNTDSGSDPSTDGPQQQSPIDSVVPPTLSDAVFESFSALLPPADAFPRSIPADAWEFLDLEVEADLRIHVPSQRADAAELWAPDRWHSSSSLTAEAWGLVALLGWPAFRGRLPGVTETRRVLSSAIRDRT